VDVAPLGLHPHRLRQLIELGRVELVSSAESVKVPDSAQAIIENDFIAGGLSEPPIPTGPGAPAVRHDDDTAGDTGPPVDGYANAERISTLEALPKDELLEHARAIGVAIRGSKLEIATRIDAAERGVTS
jgi:hypothetical protein